MRFKIKSLPDGLNQFQYETPKEGWLKTAAIRAMNSQEQPEGKIVEPIRLKVRLTQLHPDYYIEGDLNWKFERPCDRCAESFVEDIHYTFSQAYAYVAPTEAKNFELNEAGEKAEVILFNAADLNLVPLVEEQMKLSIPYHNLCRPDCKGICQHCGQNWNEGSCQCASESKPSPFEVLKKLVK